MRTLIVLALITCISYMDRVMPGALAPLIKDEFKLTDGELGMLTGFAFSLCFAVCGIPLARYADRGSRKLLITVCLAAWSGLTMMCGLVQNFWQMFAARLAVGAAESGSAPASFSLMSDLFAPAQRPLAMGIYLAGTMVGVILGLSAAGWVAASHGWRSAFLILGAPGLLLAVVAWFTIKEPARGTFDQIAPQSQGPQPGAGIGALLANRGFMWLTIGNGLMGFSVLGLAQWLPMFFIRSHGMDLATIALLFGVAFGVGMLIGQIVGGVWGSRLSRRHYATLHLSIGAALALGPCYLVVLWMPDERLAIAMAFVAAFVGALYSPSASAAGQTILPPHLRATGQAVINFFVAMVGGGLGPLAVGMLSDAMTPYAGEEALRWALTVALLMNVAAALCFWIAGRLIGRRHRRELAEPGQMLDSGAE